MLVSNGLYKDVRPSSSGRVFMNTNKDDKVNLERFAELTGFPLELIRKELFSTKETSGEISLEELRGAMLAYLDSTMLTANS